MEKYNNITAHSGAEDTAPNSLDYIHLALTCGCDGLEIDIRKNDKGEFILSHNPTQEDAVKLTQAFFLISESTMYVNCDLKQEGIAAEVYQLALHAGIEPERIMFTGSIRPKEVPSVPGSVIFMNLDEAPFEGVSLKSPILNLKNVERAAELFRSSGSMGMNLNYFSATSEVRKICANHSLAITVWTPGLVCELKNSLGMKAYSITTRRPLRAIALREKIG